MKYLRDNPLACVSWGQQCAIYWNGKITIAGIDETRFWA